METDRDRYFDEISRLTFLLSERDAEIARCKRELIVAAVDAEQARREGWEQCKREATDIAEKLTYEFTNESAFNRGYLRASTECMEQIAAMTYKEAESGHQVHSAKG